ncbi:MAG: hypothetical protein D6813_14630, partial [Calditrichaeota bacterium]
MANAESTIDLAEKPSTDEGVLEELTPPSLDDLSQDTVIAEYEKEESPWVNEILSSEDIPSAEPDLEEIDTLLGGPPESAPLETVPEEIEQEIAEQEPLPAQEIAEIPDEYLPEANDIEVQEKKSESSSEPAEREPSLDEDLAEPQETLPGPDEPLVLTEEELDSSLSIFEDQNEDDFLIAADIPEESADESEKIASEATFVEPEPIPSAETTTIGSQDEIAPEQRDESAPQEEELTETTDQEQPAISPEEQTPAETEQEEDITLSTDELDGILEDTEEVQEVSFDEPATD